MMSITKSCLIPIPYQNIFIGCGECLIVSKYACVAFSGLGEIIYPFRALLIWKRKETETHYIPDVYAFLSSLFLAAASFFFFNAGLLKMLAFFNSDKMPAQLVFEFPQE